MRPRCPSRSADPCPSLLHAPHRRPCCPAKLPPGWGGCTLRFGLARAPTMDRHGEQPRRARGSRWAAPSTGTGWRAVKGFPLTSAPPPPRNTRGRGARPRTARCREPHTARGGGPARDAVRISPQRHPGLREGRRRGPQPGGRGPRRCAHPASRRTLGLPGQRSPLKALPAAPALSGTRGPGRASRALQTARPGGSPGTHLELQPIDDGSVVLHAAAAHPLQTCA